ncbi:MAG: S8 family serine peptidase [bacterium]|nr:S8 family serine peptidase [bacterium]
MRSGRLFAIVLLAGVLAQPPLVAGTNWETKVDPWVLRTTGSEGEAQFLVRLVGEADLSAAALRPSKLEKTRYVFESLRRKARQVQAPVLAVLRARGVEHRAFWIANVIWVRGDIGLVEELALRADVAEVEGNPRVRLERPVLFEGLAVDAATAAAAVEPGIAHTGAVDEFWSHGYRGQTIVIGGQDTGYDWEHPAIRGAYRGWDGQAADHNYNWHDAIHSGGGRCGADTVAPCDDGSHGTHTMGTMVGDDGDGNRIGMAPGAQWIGCRNMDQGVGTPATYTECFEWFLAPTDLEGRNPDPARAPDVINNSWVCPPTEGCTRPNVLRKVVRNMRAAGIVVVAAAGNRGPECGTLAYSPAIYDKTLSVAAISTGDTIAGFSSRGPVLVDGSGRPKPDVAAPGLGVRSSVPGGGYASSTGTSMAAPHVTGLVALTLSAATCMRPADDRIEEFVKGSARPLSASQTCGDLPGSQSPNNTFGWGAVRALRPLCRDESVGGLASGVEPEKVVCRNRTQRVRKTVRLNGQVAWDCEAAGVPAAAGDRVRLILTGKADGSRALGASLSRIEPTKAVCRNLTTGKKKRYKLEGTVSWDCQDKGLAVTVSDEIKQIIVGRVRAD